MKDLYNRHMTDFNSNLKIAIVEDDELARIGLRSLLSGHGVVSEFSQGERALHLESYDFDLAFIDLDLEEKLLGLEVIEKFSSEGVYCVVLSGHEDESSIVQSYELGAKDYLVKPIDYSTVEALLSRYDIEKQLFSKDNESSDLIENIPRNVLEDIRAFSFHKNPLIIRGETGVGKTYLVKNIHKLLRNSFGKSEVEFPFIDVNCSEFNESLIESELFGHVKGAFTGSSKDHTGLFERANGGILFIDEIGTLSLSLQKKLLKVIEEKSFVKVGGEHKIEVDFILVTATCDNLESLIIDKKFRRDLFERLKGTQIKLQSFHQLPLNKRESILNNLLKNKRRRIALSSAARELILTKQWPGNFREIKNMLESLSSKGIGVIQVDNVKTFLNYTPLRQELFSNLITLVEEEGLPSVIENIEKYIVNHFYKKNEHKTKQTINDLKISNNMFYKYIDKENA